MFSGMITQRAVRRWLMMVVLLLMPMSALAQPAGQPNELDGDQLSPQWLISIEPKVDGYWTDAWGRERVDVRSWVPLEPQFRLSAWFNEAFFGDVTALATWSITPADCGTVIGPGVIRVVPRASVRIRAEWNGQVVEIPMFTGSGIEYGMAPDPVQGDQGGVGFRGVPRVPAANLRTGVNKTLDKLGGYGLPIGELRTAANAANFRDGTGDPQVDGGPLLAKFNAPMRFTPFSPTVTLAPTAAREIDGIGGGESLLTASGFLKPSVKALVHELLHAVVHEHGLGNFDDDTDGAAHPYGGFSAFEDSVLAPVVEIAEAGKPETPAEEERLRTKLARIAHWYRDYAKDKADDEEHERRAKEGTRKLLKEVSMDDADGNGIPDFVEGILRRMRLIPKDWYVPMLDPS